MARTNAWSKLIPLDSDQASGAAGDQQQLRLDIEERMDDLVGWIADDDPLVLKDAQFTPAAATKIYYSHVTCHTNEDDDDLEWLSTYFNANDPAGGDRILLSVDRLPVGAVISEWSVFALKPTTSGNITVNLKYIPYTVGGTPTAVGAGTTEAMVQNVREEVGIDSLSHTIVAGGYFFEIDPDSNRLYVYGAMVEVLPSALIELI